MPDSESDISSIKKVKAATNFSKELRAAHSATKKTSVWKTPAGLDPTEMLLGYNLHFISTMLPDKLLYALRCSLRPELWSLVRRSRFDPSESKLLWSTSAASPDCMGKTQQCVTKRPRIVCAPAGALEKVAIGSYYESLASADLRKKS